MFFPSFCLEISAKKRKINRTFTIDSSETKIHSLFLNFNKEKKIIATHLPPKKQKKKKHTNPRFSKRKKKKRKEKEKEKGEAEKDEQYEDEHVSAVCRAEAHNWTNRNSLQFHWVFISYTADRI